MKVKKWSKKSSGSLSSSGIASFKDEEQEITELIARKQKESPLPGQQRLSKETLQFEDLPLSSRTIAGLTDAGLTICTDIQAAAIPHALAGRDILGAAKTGSGKTLAFVIPLVERLYCERWSSEDGLAALIVTPTRELALQIFEVVRIVGKKHMLSAGLITGGKKEFEEEKSRIVGMNILVATPGRLLQHFQQSVGFDASQLMLLVLDEADRILDMGFKEQIDGIISYLPTRQTLLFSATQTKSVKDLARLSLNNPEYIAVHAAEESTTPSQLLQHYVVVPLQEKMDTLYSFIKMHLHSKMIVFFSTCSQVRFVYDLFCAMQPGIPLTSLHGKIKQERRTIIYKDFLRRKSACLLATDIAARGLDFPDVDWVVQMDAPEDSAMYIHRVGRTARYNAGGRALLLLAPSEEQPVSEALKAAGVPIKKLTVNKKQTFSVANKAASLLAAHPDYRLLAKKAFRSYLRSLQLLPHAPSKDPLQGLALDAFAASLGLLLTPEVPVMAGTDKETVREEIREKKNVNRSLDKLKKQIKEAKEAKKQQKKEAKKSVGLFDGAEVSSKETMRATGKAVAAAGGGELEEFLVVKKAAERPNIQTDSASAAVEDDSSQSNLLLLPPESSKQSKKSKKLKITIDGEGKGGGDKRKKIIFDEDGSTLADARDGLAALFKSACGREEDGKESERSKRIEEHAKRMKDLVDKGRKEDNERERQRIRDKHREKKLASKKKDSTEEDESEGAAVLLATDDMAEDDHEDGSNDEDDDEEEEEMDEDEDEDDEDDVRDDRTLGSKKRKNDSIIDSDRSDDDDDDEEQEDLRAREEIVLQMLGQKRRR